MADSVKNKILIFSLAYRPFVGGAEVAIKEITDRLPGYDWEMLTVNLDGRQKTEEQIGNIFVRRLGQGKMAKYLFPWLAYKKAKELQQEKKYDLIWAMMANQAGLAALFFKLKFPRVKYLLTLQEGDSELDIWLRTWFMRPLYKMIYRRADQIQTISNFLKRRAEKIGAKCSIEVVPNGVDPEWVTQMDYDNLVQLRKLSIFGGLSIFTTSRLVKKNGIEYLIRAMVDVDGKLIIFGDGKLRSKLEGLAKDLKIENKVDFRGFVNQEKVHDLLVNASVFCRPSLSEGLGNSFLEAMAVKIPVIATPIGGIPDFLKDGETGWFCEVKNSQSIAERINYILDGKNKAEVERVVENAKRLVEEKYSWEIIARQMNTIFVRLNADKLI
jgi:glycosyltransferase involved in cell wall biosynthesis